MFNSVSPAAVKMAATTGCTAGFTNIPGYISQINCRKNLLPEFSLFSGRVCTCSRKFSIRSSGIVTDQTINSLIRAEIKFAILPTVTRMTAGAPAPVGLGCNSEIIQGFSLALPFFVTLASGPGPVNCIVKLQSCPVMTLKTSFSHLRP